MTSQADKKLVPFFTSTLSREEKFCFTWRISVVLRSYLKVLWVRKMHSTKLNFLAGLQLNELSVRKNEEKREEWKTELAEI